MKQQIRNNVFETNSSSVHSLVVKQTEKFVLKLNKYNNDSIVAQCHNYYNYGHEQKEYIEGQQQKLEYLISWISVKYYNDIESTKNSWEYSTILEAVQSVDDSIKDILIQNIDIADFNHQTCPESEECVANLYDLEEIRNFIFNENILVECYFD